ncbi:ATP-binding protein [Enterococcus faecalis]|uniref:ATP-binding protein n=1 Tax=Enterococcus faecalis TaxID=1351 RepID=UPI003CC6634D
MATKFKIPAKKIYGNLLVTETNEVWAYYRVPLENISGQNKEKQEEYKESVELFLQGLRKYKELEISVEPVSFELPERVSLLSQSFDEANKELAENIEERTVQILNEELKFLTSERLIIGVKLSSTFTASTFKGKCIQYLDQVVYRVLALGNYEIMIDREFLERYRATEEMVFQRFGAVRGSRLTQKELRHHIEYPFVRGLDRALSEMSDMNEGLHSLTDSIIDTKENQGYIELSTKAGKSYVSLLPIYKFPVNMWLNHVVSKVQELPFPVEFQLKGKFVPLKGANGLQGKSKRANTRLKNFAQESLEMGDSEKKSGRLNRYILMNLDEKIEKREPIIKWFGIFAVFGSTLEECRKRSAQVIDYCESMKVEVVNGLADQDVLFHAFLAGQESTLMKNWVHYTTAQGISELMFGVDNRIGDRVGFPIGRVSTLGNVDGLKPEQIARACRKVVMFNPFLANQAEVAGKASSSPHIAITGPTGGGKSFLAKLIFFYCSLLTGKGLYIDPKSEYKKWLMKVADNPYYQEHYPLFVAYIHSFHFVTLDPNQKQNEGVLDPLNYLSGAEVQDTLETIFEQIYDFSTKEDARTEMLKGIKSVIARKEEGQQVGLLNVLDYMVECGNEEAVKSGNAILERVEGSILELAFSRGENNGLNLTEHVTILEVAGLDIPDAKESSRNYTSSQRKSLALMMCLGKFCEAFGLKDQEENTFILFDEAWVFSSSRGGSKVIKAMRRVGRTFNNMLVLITQSIKDTQSDEDSGNFGRIFAFDKSDERELILEHVGLEVTSKNIEFLRRMPQYHCLYLDIYGRVGRMLVYCPFEEVTESFRTVERNESANAEEQFVA